MMRCDRVDNLTRSAGTAARVEIRRTHLLLFEWMPRTRGGVVSRTWVRAMRYSRRPSRTAHRVARVNKHSPCARRRREIFGITAAYAGNAALAPANAPRIGPLDQLLPACRSGNKSTAGQ